MMSETTLQIHQWVRIKQSGPYEGDLGLVEFIEGGSRALVKLIPRISQSTNEKGELKLTLATKKNTRFGKDEAISNRNIRV